MFIEAARFLKLENPGDVVVIMVSYLPVPGTIGEMKTRPTQHAVHQLNSYGISADFIVARAEHPLDDRRKEKLAVSCNIPVERIISAPDIKSIYDVPENFEKDKLGTFLEKALSLKARPTHLEEWSSFAKKVTTPKKEVNIAIVGKYFDTGDFVLSDAYVSVIEAVKFSAYNQGAKPKITWMNSKHFEGDSKKAESLCKEKFANIDGIIVPGGFGETGIEGKINVIKYARENKIPYFGLCYGMQLMVVEYARHKAGLTGAHTTEINPNAKEPVIDIMEHQKKHMANGNYGGSMRLGEYPCVLKSGTLAKKAYETAGWGKGAGDKYAVTERHRHRFEVNNAYVADLKKAGLIFSGTSPDGSLMEIAELPKSVHPFFLGTQFHPEFLARPLNPHPLFTDFIKASLTKGLRK